MPILKLGSPLLLSLKYSDQGLSSTPLPLSRMLSALLSQLVSYASPTPAALSVQRACLPHPRRGRGSTRRLCAAVPGPSASFLLTRSACSPSPGSPPPTPPSHSSRGCGQIQKLGSPQSQSSLFLFSRNSHTKHARSTHASYSSSCPSFTNDIVPFPASVARTPSHDFAIVFPLTGFRDIPGGPCWK